MKRKIYQDLLAWKNSGAASPLIVLGARQVGKTYIIEHFCKSEFDNYVKFNLLDRADIVSLFKENITTQEKIDRLELFVGHKIDFENTLIFFDEVHISEEILSACKFFAESKTKYKVICAGTLLKPEANRYNVSSPVGKTNLLSMFPLDFEEFLWANDNELLAKQIRSCFTVGKKMVSSLHNESLLAYRTYLCIGGMPKSVVNFIENGRNVLLFDSKILDDIQTSCVNDMSTFIKSSLIKTKAEAIYDSVPNQLSNASGKFMYSKIRKGAKGRDYISPMEWLESSGMVYRSKMVEKPLAPLKGHQKVGYFKLYLNDPALLRIALGIKANTILLDEDFACKGLLAENYVAGQLVASGKPLFYWRSENTAEVDFLLTNDDGIIPLEVTAGRRADSPSLRVYQTKFDPTYTLRICARNFSCDDKFKTIPLYAAFCL